MIRRFSAACVLLFLAVTCGWAQLRVTTVASNRAIDVAIAREHQLVQFMSHYSPRVETYIQDLKADKELGTVPVRDEYFLGRLFLKNGVNDSSFLGSPSLAHRLTSFMRFRYVARGFAQMVLLDTQTFDHDHYTFDYRGRDFLGDVRCLMYEVTPRKHAGMGLFEGRIWVEDQGYNIVRFKGTYTPHPRLGYYFHFDSWREAVKPGLWLPAMIYSEESDMHTFPKMLSKPLHFKAETRIWGYNLRNAGQEEESAEIHVDPATAVDKSDAMQHYSPLQSQRAWEHEAEQNLLERMQRAGLVAPAGDIDKVMETVANNLIAANNLNIQPDVHCRVLLTEPLESFTIGHNIVLSRGLIDVLPNESSLAAMIAHELAHIVLGHRLLDTKYAFNDRMMFPDEDTLHKFSFGHSRYEEEAADAKAIELLNHSPYKSQLGAPGLFLRQVANRAPALPHLLRPNLGDPIAAHGQVVRLVALMNAAPQLQINRIDQIAALTLGQRLDFNPWSDRTELIKTQNVALISARDKMPLEVAPLRPYLTRQPLNEVASAPATTTRPMPLANVPAAAGGVAARIPEAPQPRK